jgi:hypothetical protein
MSQDCKLRDNESCFVESNQEDRGAGAAYVDNVVVHTPRGFRSRRHWNVVLGCELQKIVAAPGMHALANIVHRTDARLDRPTSPTSMRLYIGIWRPMWKRSHLKGSNYGLTGNAR